MAGGGDGSVGWGFGGIWGQIFAGGGWGWYLDQISPGLAARPGKYLTISKTSWRSFRDVYGAKICSSEPRKPMAVLSATCMAPKRLPLRTSAIRRCLLFFGVEIENLSPISVILREERCLNS